MEDYDYDYDEQPTQKRESRHTGRKILTTLSIIIVLAAAGWVFFKFFFVFGKGVKAGELNLFVHKGYVFKTYEGRLIQAGYSSKETGSGVQSNEFNFSVTDENVARELERCAGKFVELHYKEYLGTLPWRGMSHYVVDSVLSSTQITQPTQPTNPVELPTSVPTELF